MRHPANSRYHGTAAFLFCFASLLLLFALTGCRDRSSQQAAQPTNAAPSSTSANYKEGGQKIAEGAQQIGRAVQGTAEKTWDSVKAGAGKAGEQIKVGAQKTGEAIKDTAQKVGDKLKSTNSASQ